MTSEVLSCPYCNSTVTLLTPPRKGQRLRCPRCDEVIPYKSGGTDEEARLESIVGTQSDALTGAGSVDIPSPPPRRWSNWSLAAVILLVMGMMATIALIFAWYTMEWRRSRDRLNAAAGPQVEQSVSVAPAQLAALGYLPADTNVIVGIHVAELLDNVESRDLLSAPPLRTDGGAANFGIGQIERWTGIKAEDLDHAVLGVKASNERLLPRWTLVVQTRRPYDTAKLLKTIKAGRKQKRHDRTLHRFTLDQPPISGVLWLPSERVLVISMLEEDLDAVPATPTPGIERFPSSLVRWFEKELPTGTQAWLVGDVKEWDTTMTLLSVFGLKKEEWEFVTKVRTFATWLRVHDEASWKLVLACTDPAAAEELDAYFADKGRGAVNLLKLLDSWPETQALVQDLSRTLTREHNDNWLIMQARSDLKSVRRAVGERRDR